MAAAVTKSKVRTVAGDLPGDSLQEVEFLPEIGDPVDMEEKVSYRLFRDSGRYSEPVFVGVNGRTFLVPRGKTVMVPRFVAQVLDDSEAMRDRASARSDELESEFITKTEHL